MRYRRVGFYLAVMGVCAAGCETTKSDQEAAPIVSAAQDQTSQFDDAALAALVARAQKARDRELKQVPEFEAVTGFERASSNEPATSDLLDEQRRLGQILFDLDAPAPPGRSPFSDLARYDAEKNRIFYIFKTGDGEERQALERALVAAIVEAIDQQYAGPFEPSSSWDEALAGESARLASVFWALAAAELSDLSDLGEKNAQFSLDALALRPELALELESVGAQLDFSAVEERRGPKDAHIAELQRYFVARDAIKLAAALYRSGGWSGVELARAMPPARSIDAARPDLWMSGEAVGKWLWPADEDGEVSRDTVLHEGEVGAHLMAAWLSGVADAALVQSLQAGYLSDSYRFLGERSDDLNASDASEGADTSDESNDKYRAPTRFEWLTMWNSPASAEAVARAFELAMRQRYGQPQGKQSASDAGGSSRGDVRQKDDKKDENSAPFTVFSRGLVVGVIIDLQPSNSEVRGGEEIRRSRAEALLDGHKVELVARTPLPLKFQPTRADAHVEAMARATMVERVWESEELNLRFDLSDLGDDWRVQQPDLSDLRWFARHEDGALLQLTVELDDPLGPAFQSDIYRERVADRLKNSMKRAAIESVDFVTDGQAGALDDPGFSVQVRGQLDGAKKVVKLWQFHRGDLVLSYSLQAPAERFGAHEKAAEAILSGVGRLGKSQASSAEDPSPQPESASGDGSIEYEIED